MTKKFEPADWGPIPEYMRDGITAYFETGREPGDFLMAVLENNLQMAVARADDRNKALLWEYMVFLRENAPLLAWGTKGRVRMWLETGGFAGKEGVSRHVTFEYRVPVHVRVKDGRVEHVTIMDDHPIIEPMYAGGNANYLSEAVRAAKELRTRSPGWPKWEMQSDDRAANSDRG